MDLVQFIYAFFLTPTMLIWIKTVVFFNLESGLNITDQEDKFLIDTIITTLSFFIYAFVVIHSLTKTFAIKKAKDPLVDIFEHSEYFHLWLSHIVTYSSGLLIILSMGVINMYKPILIFSNKSNLYLGIAIGLVLSLLFYYALAIYKVESQKRFDRVMKLQIYLYTFGLMTGYLIFRPKYSPQYTLFWCSIMFFIGTTALSQVLKRTRKKQLHQINKNKALVI